jgi:ubiquinone biosynthesis protein Coq4
MLDRAEFQQRVVQPDMRALAQAVRLAKQGRFEGREVITAALAWAAFACPAAITAIYDTVANSWLGSGDMVPLPEQLAVAPLEDSFWEAFWTVVDGQDYDATSITVAVAALGGALHPSMEQISENAARAHPGAAAALTHAVPGRTDVEVLATCPEGSLGYTLYRMIVDNGYDLEVLDREAIQLGELPQALQYLNVRILQMHDVWHLVAGYTTSGSHEIAISAFQLAQFGHNYSAMFLAVGAMMSHANQSRAFPILMQLMMEAWEHGRRTPAMMDIEWEREWRTPIPELRQKYSIEKYRSVLPDDLLETATEASFWKKLGLGLKMAQYSRRLRRGEFLRAA